MTVETVLFDTPGPVNTDTTLDIARRWLSQHGDHTLLVATTTGETAVRALEKMTGKNIIAVTHSAGFRNANEQQLTPGNRARIESLGGKILTCQHALAGLSRAVRFKFNTYEIDEIIAATLKIFGPGLKVAVEIVLMAADAGLVRTDADIVAVGGTGRGADTAAVIRPANVARFFDLRVRTILCKSWNH